MGFLCPDFLVLLFCASLQGFLVIFAANGVWTRSQTFIFLYERSKAQV